MTADTLARLAALPGALLVTAGSLMLEHQRRQRRERLEGWDLVRWISALLLWHTALWGPWN